MKVKEVERSVSACWSPQNYSDGVLLATGTAVHQVDITSVSASAPTSTIDIYDLNLSEPGMEMQLRATTTGQNKFHKLAWGGVGSGNLVGGCDGGVIEVYSINKMLNNETSLLTSPMRHTGAVRTLDFNPFQTNLLASGACESEIYIWDLNNMSTPMAPGAKPQPYEDVVWLAWNRQVQHILASTFSTRCIVWDLKKNTPVIKLTDSTSRVRWKTLSWHPDIATQLCLASEDDSNPVIQLWDLRFATSPIKTLRSHTRGVLSLSWCNQDPDLLISSAKDNKILCWNPNSNEANGEIVCEISNTQQWIFDVSWCPKNPLLIASCSCDNNTSIYSLMGTSNNQIETTNKIADSFPGMEQMNQVDVAQPGSHHTQSNASNVVLLRNPPKWLRRPCGASFSFGGKLVTFGTNKGHSAVTGAGDMAQGSGSIVKINQVITEGQLVERCREVQEALNREDLSLLWDGKQDPIWSYLRATFQQEPAIAIKALLGYEQVTPQISKGIDLKQNFDIDSLTDNMATLNQVSFNSSNLNQNGMAAFDSLSAVETSPERKITPFKISTDNADINGRVCKSLLMGNIEEAVDISLHEGRMADALMLSMAAGPEVLAKTQHKYFKESRSYLSYIIEALVTEDWKKVVANCDLKSWKEALVAVLTHCKQQDLTMLCEELGARLEEAGGAENLANAEICYIASGNIGPLIHKRTTNTALNSETIQDLVELVLVGERAMAARGEAMNEASQAEVAFLMYTYADMLASQGHLETALAFINHIQSECVVDLKERLYIALGYKAPQQQQDVMPQTQTQVQYPQQQHYQAQQQIQPRQGYHPRKHSIPIATYQNNATGQQQQRSSVQPLQGPPLGVLPPSSGVPPVPSVPPSVGTPSLPLASTGRTTPLGPPPPSVSSPALVRNTPSPHTSHGGMPSKKYLVDPSVIGIYGNTGSRGMVMPVQQQPLYTSTPSSAPTGYSGSVYTQQQQPGIYQPVTPPVDQLAPLQPSQFQPHPPSHTSPMPGGAPTSSSGQMGGGFMAPDHQQQPMLHPPPGGPSSLISSAQTTNTAAPGWNDPPLISAPPRSQFSRSSGEMSAVHAGTRKWDKVISSHAYCQTQAQMQSHSQLDDHNYSRQVNKTEVVRQNPITHPLFGTAPQGGNTVGQEQQMAPIGGMAPVPSGGMPPPPPSGVPPPQHGMPPQHPGMQPTYQPYYKQQQQPSNETMYNAHIPQPQINGGGYGEETRVNQMVVPQKAPLPEQYKHMQSTFEQLRLVCAAKATNPQLKKKLDEIARKLEALYDSLRESKLSARTISSLEELVRLVEAGDYRGALTQQTSMVSSGTDFAQIASFMPGLKTLTTLALQLGAYLN